MQLYRWVDWVGWVRWVGWVWLGEAGMSGVGQGDDKGGVGLVRVGGLGGVQQC